MLRKVEFAAGYVKDESPLASEGGYVDGDKMRGRQGRMETIGGWTPAVEGTFTGIARGAKAWTDLDGNELAAWGTADKLYALNNGAIVDVTPSYFSEGVLAYPYLSTSTKTANYTAVSADDRTSFAISSASAITFTLPNAALPTGWKIGITFTGAGSLSIDGYGTNDKINGSTDAVSLVAGDIVAIAFAGGDNTPGSPLTFTLDRTSAFLHPFETTSGSSVVKVNHPEHGLVAGQSIAFSNATAVGGITPTGTYTVTTILSRDKYTITHGSNASSTANGGVRVDYKAAWTTGVLNGSSNTAGSSFTTTGDLPVYAFSTDANITSAFAPSEVNNGTAYSVSGTGYSITIQKISTVGWKVGFVGGVGISGITIDSTFNAVTGLYQLFSSNGSNLITLSAGELLTVELTAADYFTVSQNTGLIKPFATTNASAIVTVTRPAHGLAVGQAISFSGASAVGGITINGAYTVTSVVSANQYTITHGSNATSTAAGGGTVHYTITWTIPASAVPTPPSVWSLDNFGETLLAVRRGGPLYQYQPATSYPEINSGTFAAGTGWSYATSTGTATAGTASNLSQNVEGVVKAGYVYRIVFTVTRTAGNLYFKINCGDPAAVISVGDASEAISLSGSYSLLFVAPSDPIDIVFSKDATFAGTVSAISLKLENKAYIVPEAPRHIDVMWVDPARIVCLGGTFEADGDYNPTLIRWSDQENLRQWISTATNLSGEQPLSSGGRVVSVQPTRGQTLIGTDAGIHSMQFTGDASAFAITQRGTGNAPMGRHAMCEHNGRVVWWGANGNFYVYDGAAAQAIPWCRVRRDAFNNMAQYQQEKTFIWPNSTFSEFWCHYPDARDGVECSRVVVLNLDENHCVTHTFARTAAIPTGIFDYPIMLSTSGDVFYHEYGHAANGSALAAYLETAYFDVEDGEDLMVIKEIVPDFDDQVGDVSFTLKSKAWPNKAEITSPTYTHTPTTTDPLKTRFMGRQIKIILTSLGNPSFWRLGLLRLRADKTGNKR